MANRFYGAKGNVVKLIQRQLNRAGAGIREDGLWGDETEDAYNRFSNQLLGSKNDGDTAGAAKAAPLTKYDQDLQFAQDKAKRLTQAMQTSIQRLDPDYKMRLEALEKAYTKGQRDLQGTVLTRGMGRSSYAADIAENEYAKWRSDQAALLEEKKRSLEDLNADIADIQASLSETEAKINLQKQEAAKKASHRNSGGGGRKRSGTANKKGKWELDVMQNWYRMSTGAKVAYFEKNWEQIYRKSAKIARQMAKDLEETTGRQYMLTS